MKGDYCAVKYIDCPCCNWASIGVNRFGKIVRHSINMGYVERGRSRFKSTICKASGKTEEEASIIARESRKELGH